MEGSASRAEPSTLKPEIVEGSISQARTLHENAPHHGRFRIQSGTLRAEALNRGRFHSPDPNHPRKCLISWMVQYPGANPPRFRPESRTVQCKQNHPSTRRLDITDGSILQSRQFNMPVGMELTTSSARQDTASLGTILPDKKPATPATFVTSAPAGAMDNPALPRALSGTATVIADEYTVGILLVPLA